jgi:hypothetical protein
MKKAIWFALFLYALTLNSAQADTNVDFVRIACVPENGLLDVEYRSLHDSVAGPADARKALGRADPLEKAGFYRPSGLAVTCQLGGVQYVVKADQGEQTNFLCGGSPAISLTVSRDGVLLFSDVIFGDSCSGRPSLMGFSIGDGPKSWRGRETKACYATGKDSDPHVCDWTFGSKAQFDKEYPVDQGAIDRIVNRSAVRK